MTRVYGVSDTSGVADPEYAEGLRVAVTAALDYGLEGIQRGDERVPPVPVALLVQARMAARAGISLDTVMRRYFAGYALLGDFLVEEAERGGLHGAGLKSVLRTQAALLDRLVIAVGKEHADEAEGRHQSSEDRRAERVRRLLAGELLDSSGLNYDLSAHHLGVVASGPDAEDAVRELASSFDCRLLLVRRGEGVVWGWLGARRRLELGGFASLSASDQQAQMALAIGEPSHDLAGWRLTHRQAQAALPIALRSPKRVVRYADVALLASIIGDDLLATSLRELYLTPLSGERDGGTVLRETLRAYFAAERNVSSAASALGVTRRTVANRLRMAEERIGRPLGSAAMELDAALRLDAWAAGAP